jgi:hypothetical protein
VIAGPNKSMPVVTLSKMQTVMSQFQDRPT